MSRTSLTAVVIALSSLLTAQDATIRGQANVLHRSKNESGSADVVVWLTRTRTNETVSPGAAARLLQKNKRFTPHTIAVTTGTAIEFPNQDLFFHNVFSIYHGKPFDLGLYEGGTVRTIRFSKPGVSYIFCNIHPEMSAAVVTLRTPHFAVTARDGSFQISRVPPGRYTLGVWYELASEAELTSLSRNLEITVGDNALGTITLHSSDAPPEHLNKYGEPYLLDKSTNY
jgi:plastocyanin